MSNFYDSCDLDVEKNSNENNLQSKAEEQMETLKSSNYIHLLFNNNLFLIEGIANNQNNNLNYKTKKLLGKRREIFEIIYPSRQNINNKKYIKHTGDALDNISKIIIRHFVNFFINFINFAVSEGLKKKLNKDLSDKMKFQIRYKLKETIFIEDITKKTVEQLLKFKPIRRRTIKSNAKRLEVLKNNNLKNHNEFILNEIKKGENLGSSFDKLFKTQVIDLFNDIYIQNKKEVDLKHYGIEGIKLNLSNNEYKTYEILKVKYGKNKKKLEKFENLIVSKFVSPFHKPIYFKIEKKN